MTSPIIIFDTLQSVALVCLLLPFTVALLSKSIGRMKTWYSLVFSCIVYCISFLLLVGHQSSLKGEKEPPLGLCVVQAGAIYAAPPAIAAACLEFVIELYWRLSSALLARKMNERNVTRLLFLAPIVHAIIFWVDVAHGLSYLPSIQRDPSGIYCHIASAIPTLVTGGIVIGFVVLSVTVEGYTVYLLWKTRRVFHEVKRSSRQPKQFFPFSLFVRATIYTLIAAIALIITVRLNVMPENTPEYVASMHTLAIIPLSVALLFGLQKDILQAFMCRRKKDLFDLNGDSFKSNNSPEP